MKEWRLPIFLVLVYFLNACGGGGCPKGEHSFNGQCVPDQTLPSDENPFIPLTDGDGPVVELPDVEQSPPPQDYNEIPSQSAPVPSEDVSGFDIETGNSGVLVWISGNDDNMIFPSRIVNPEGTEVYNYQADAQNGAINDDFDFHFLPDASLGLFIPNTPRLSASVGPWSIEINSISEGNELSLMQFDRPERQDGDPPNSIPINIWLIHVAGVDAENAGVNTEFKPVLNAFRQSLETAGVTVDTMNFIDASSENRQRYGVVDGMAEYREMLAISSMVDNNWPNVFLVKNFSGDLAGILGLASQIPGPPGLQGTGFSGVAVATDYYEYFPRIIGLAMAHELGHWLGLFHPTEYDGHFHDALDDTPECVAELDGNSDGRVDNQECAEHGENNVMFWLVPFSDDFEIGPNGQHFSEDQAWVLDRNPVWNYIR